MQVSDVYIMFTCVCSVSMWFFLLLLCVKSVASDTCSVQDITADSSYSQGCIMLPAPPSVCPGRTGYVNSYVTVTKGDCSGTNLGKLTICTYTSCLTPSMCPIGSYLSAKCVDGYMGGAYTLTPTPTLYALTGCSTGTCSQCGNLPANAYYTGYGTSSSNCPWSCNAGYTAVGESCMLPCDAGYYFNGQNCSLCSAGGYSLALSASCSSCLAGKCCIVSFMCVEWICI